MSTAQQQSRERGGGARMPTLHNPFTLRVGQVFTGFGVGCGIGIGVGRPLNLRAVPVLGNIAGEAVGSFSSIGYHVQSLVKKLGIKNLQAGVGCGVGVGHGFGIGVTLKPGAVQQLKHLMEQGLSSLNERVKSVTGTSESEESNASTTENGTPSMEKALPGISPLKGATTLPTEKLLGGLLLNPSSTLAVKAQSGQEAIHGGEVERLQTENKILQTLLTHQEQIEVLKKENATLKQALAEEIDSSSQTISSTVDTNHSMEGQKCRSRAKCFECRRRSRQRR